eukprot:10112061-Alexandrium_andersonii.AAC.1
MTPRAGQPSGTPPASPEHPRTALKRSWQSCLLALPWIDQALGAAGWRRHSRSAQVCSPSLV